MFLDFISRTEYTQYLLSMSCHLCSCFVDSSLPAYDDNIKFCWSIQWAGSIWCLYWERKSKGPLWKVDIVPQCCLKEEKTLLFSQGFSLTFQRTSVTLSEASWRCCTWFYMEDPCLHQWWTHHTFALQQWRCFLYPEPLPRRKLITDQKGLFFLFSSCCESTGVRMWDVEKSV